MAEGPLRDLRSPDPRVRFRALGALRHDYAPEAGEGIVASCVQETEPGVWWLSALCALPIWLPLFDRTLLEAGRWPFGGARTLRIIELSQGRVLHSAMRMVPEWLASPSWELRFAAFRSLKAGGSMEDACGAAQILLQGIGGSFSVDREELRMCSWMERFDDVGERLDELRRFVEECCAE